MGSTDGSNIANPIASSISPCATNQSQESPSAVSVVSMFFTKLPRELRDECYRHAYESGDDGVFNMTSLSNYMRKERDRRKYGSLRQTPVIPRETPVCPLLDMRVDKKFFEEAAEQWFRQREITCSERYVFNTICDSSPILRKCLTRFNCVWDSCYFVSDGIAEACSAFVQLKRCKGIRTLAVEVRERMFEEFNRLACVDTFTAQDFMTMQEARDLVTLPLLSSIEMRPSKCSLGITEGEKAKWIENVAALDAYMKTELKKQELVREQQKAKNEAKQSARHLERCRLQEQKISRHHARQKISPAVSSRPPSLFARARNFFNLRTGAADESLVPVLTLKQVPRERIHPALRPSTLRAPTRVADRKVTQDKIVKRALLNRRGKELFPCIDRINDLEDAYAGLQELFEGRAPPQPEPGGLATFCKNYPVVVASLATVTTISIVNSITLWNVISQR